MSRAPSTAARRPAPIARRPTSAERRRRLIQRAAPLAVGGTIAFVAGMVVGGGPDLEPAAERYAAAWGSGDLEAMYAELSPQAAREYSPERFARTVSGAAETATAEEMQAVVASDRGDGEGGEIVTLAVRADTQIFGTIDGQIELPVTEQGIEWSPEMAFPGLGPGQELARRTKTAERAPILAADGTPLAEGPADERGSPLGSPAESIAGVIGEPKGEQAAALAAAGYPDGMLAGTTGLELAFDQRLAGTPGGKLLATGGEVEQTVLAQAAPVKGQPVRTTIDTDLQSAAVSALGSTYGGVAVLDADNGDVLAVSGLGFSAPQPPGSTMKVITAAAALEDGAVSLDDQFPVETSNSEIGYTIANSHDSACGGSFVESFAESCNTVFAPLGARLGGKRLVDAAEEFGFNSPPSLYSADAVEQVGLPSSTIPAGISDSVEVGVSAIGQGEVLATPLQMASVAQTIANDGVRSPTSIVKGKDLKSDAPDVEVVDPKVAGQVTELMKAVVAGGTGVAAALPEAQVAGKTGTAELGTPSGDGEGEVDAWFTSFAPADDPKIAVAVMVINAGGDGGTVAAPIAQSVLAAGVG